MVEKGFKNGLINQLFKINNNENIFKENLEPIDMNKSDENNQFDKTLDNANNDQDLVVVYYIL